MGIYVTATHLDTGDHSECHPGRAGLELLEDNGPQNKGNKLPGEAQVMNILTSVTETGQPESVEIYRVYQGHKKKHNI